MAVDLFKKIDNTVLDLQASHSQTYDGLFKRLAQLLRHEDLEKFNSVLTKNVDYEGFLAESNASIFINGNLELQWSGDDKYDLGLKYMLVQEIGNDSEFAAGFSHDFFSSSDNRIISCIHNLVRGLIIPFVRDYKDYIASISQIESEQKPKVYENKTLTQPNKKIFLVHGHDDYVKEKVARFLEQNGFKVVILHEQASGGRTIIEKIEAHSDVGFAVILLTPDDVGKAKDEDKLKSRARQNVILELGYFMGKLGRSKVCTFKSDQLEIPTDFSGVIWNDLDDIGVWKHFLLKELREAGYDLDSSRLLSSLG